MSNVIPRPVTDESTIALTVLTEVRRAGFTTIAQITAATRIDIFRISRVLDKAVEAGIVEKDGAAYMWVEQVHDEAEEQGSAVRDHTLGTVAIFRDLVGRQFVARLESRDRLWSPVLPGERSAFFAGVLGTVVAVLHSPG